MNITKLKSTGIKRQNIDIEPRKVNLILGKNGAGKSAIKDTLELALLGYSPEVGKRPGDIFKLSKRDPIVIDIETDGGAIHREWKRNGEGVKSTSKCDIEIPAVMLDLSSVTKLTKAERQKYFLSLLDVKEVTWESVTASIKQVEVKEPTEQTEKAIAGVIALADSAKGTTVQERLSKALDLISEQTKKVNAEIKDHEGTARTFSRQEELAFDVPVVNAKKAMQAARADVEAAAADVTKWQNALQDYETKAAKLKTLESESGGDVSELDKSLAELVSKISDAEVVLEVLRDKLAAMDEKAANELFNDLSATVATLTAEYNAAGHRGKDLEARLERVKTDAVRHIQDTENYHSKEITRVKADINAIQKKRDEFASYEICPTCGTPGETWKADLLQSYDDNIKELQRRITDVTKSVDTDKAAFNESVASDIADLEKQITAVAEELATIKTNGVAARQRKDAAALLVKACEDKRQAVATAQATLNKLNYERQTLTKEREELVSIHAQNIATVENLKTEMDNTDLVEISTQLETATSTLDAKREAQDKADADLRRETIEMSNKLTLLKSMKRRDEVTAEQTILKGATKVLLEIQQKAINGAFEPLVMAIRKFTDGVLDTPPIDFHDGEFGYWLDDIFVEIDTFSGSQRRLALLGQMIAFASASGAPLKVAIIDELGDFEPTVTRPALIERMMDLTWDGVIDHVFMMSNDVEYYNVWRNGSLDVLVHDVESNEVIA